MNEIICICAGLDGPHCGLFPIGASPTVRTTGLRWNLQADRMSMGGLVSSSNLIAFDDDYVTSAICASSSNSCGSVLVDETLHVTVSTDHPVLWTCEIVSFW